MNYQAPPSSVVVSRPSAPETSTGCAVCSGDFEYDYDYYEDDVMENNAPIQQPARPRVRNKR